MGQLVDGKWSTENVLVQHDAKGLYFKRDSVFRERISSEAKSEFPAEPGRYHLYCAVACPWAHRATLMRTLKRLEPFVTLTNTFQEPGGQGWSFGEAGHIVPGTDRRVRWLHELYTIADPACTTRVTVPTLWDAKTRRIVNNESSEIIRIFNSAFTGVAQPTPDYYPEALRPAIEATNALVLKGVNNAVNGCGYSISQQAYDSSVKLLFETLMKGSADSFALRNHGMKAVLPNIFPERAFSTDYMRKDLGYALDLAENVGAKIHGAELAARLLEEASEAGFGDFYWPVVSRVIGA